MAWQVGVKECELHMRNAKDRMRNAKEFAEWDLFDQHLRTVVGRTLCSPESPATIEEIIEYHRAFLGQTMEGQRVKY
jgi:hypothetical protein